MRNAVLIFIFAGFLLGFVLALRFVRRPRRALVLGFVLGAAPLALMFGPGSSPIEGIGSFLNFAFFALGPLMLIPFIASGTALGVASGALVLWVGRGRARWVGWSAGTAMVGIVAVLTLLPVGLREIAKHEAVKDRVTRSETIIRSNFNGTLAGHQVNFPASPRLHLAHNCDPDLQTPVVHCHTALVNPVTILTGSEEKLLHERSDPIKLKVIRVDSIQPNCGGSKYCLTQAKVERWCREIRPDQANSIWCRVELPMRFSLRTETPFFPADRKESELSARFANTPLGPGRVACFYHPDPSRTDRQGAKCKLTFDLAEGVQASFSVRRAQLASNDSALAATLALIPDYWAELTGN